MMYAMVDNNINHLQFLGLQGSAYNQIAYMEASGKSLNVIGCVTGSNLSCTSDSTLKTDITKYNPNLENLSSLECVTFRWKDLPQTPFTADSNSKQVGLIAQEVEKAFPELVYTDSRGYKAISYNGLSRRSRRGQKSEIRGQRRRNFSGLLIIDPSIFPTSAQAATSSLYCCSLMY